MTFTRQRSRVIQESVEVSPKKTYTEDWNVGGSTCGRSTLATWFMPPEYTDHEGQTTWDSPTENFLERRNRGEIIENPFRSWKLLKKFCKAGNYSHDFGSDQNVVPECSPGVFKKRHCWLTGYKVPNAVPDFLWTNSTPSITSDLVDLAVTQAHANIDPSAMLALATAAESRKTVDSLAAILKRAIKIAKHLRRLNVKALRKELSAKEVADRYMEMRYALRPMIYDVKGIMKALSVERSHIRQTFRGYASGTTEVGDSNLWLGLAWLAEARWERSYKCAVSVRAGVLCDVNVTSVNVYGIDQPIETMWELVPFSFILDWFVNVGDTVAAWTPNAGVTQRASWATVRETRTAVNKVVEVRSLAKSLGGAYTNASYASSAYANISYSGSECSQVELFQERIINPQLSILPSFNMRMDMFKLTDLGIILRNLLR